MGLLTKTKEFKATEECRKDLPRYFSFKECFSHFLDEVGALSVAFLVKHAGLFHLAFPLSFDVATFKSASFDASYSLEGTFVELFSESMDGFANIESEAGLKYLRENSILIPMDERRCFFLFLKLKEGDSFFSSQEKRDSLLSCVEAFKKTYKENETLIETCTLPISKGLGFSFVESKLKGAVIASTVANIIKISFESVFDLSLLEENIEDLKLFYSMANRISILIGSSNLAVLEKNYSLNVCIFSSQLLDEGIYTMTLKSVLSSIYGSSLIDKLTIKFEKGVSSPKEEIKRWIENIYYPSFS